MRLHVARVSRRRSASRRAERLDGIRFGVPPELTGEGIEDGVKAVFEESLKRIEDLGGELVEVSLPHSPATASPPTT